MTIFKAGVEKEKGGYIYPYSRNINLIQQANRKVQINPAYFQKTGKERVKVRKGGPYVRIVETEIFKKQENKKLDKDSFTQHEKYNMKNSTQKYNKKNAPQKIQRQETEDFE